MSEATITTSTAVFKEPLLSVRDLSKSFGSVKALDGVSLEIARGEIHCLLGENGAGKSTLCNIIFGVYRADTGEMRFNGALHQPVGPREALSRGIAMVHQHFSLVPDLTVVDNLLLGQSRGILNRAEYANRIVELSHQYGMIIEPFRLVEELSVGSRQRVEIVKCLMRNPQLLVLDEPTAVLLPEEIDGLLSVCERVAKDGCSVVLVTHKLAEVKRAAHRVSVLRGGRTVAQSDQPARDMDKLVHAMIQRQISSIGETMVGTLFGESETKESPKDRSQSGDLVLQVEGMNYKDTQGVLRLDNVNLKVHRHEIVGVAGVEGNGQSELAAILGGMIVPLSGRFLVAGDDLTGQQPNQVTAAGVGVVPEDRHLVGCVLGMSLAENLFLNQIQQFCSLGILNRVKLRTAASERMSKFDVRAAGPSIVFSSLSGGNQQKAVLARELNCPNLSLLVAAQPTRGLDVGAMEAIYQHIKAAANGGAGVLLISSELDELISVADRIVVMFRGKVMGECPARFDLRDKIGALMAGHET